MSEDADTDTVPRNNRIFNRVIAEQGAVDDVERARREIAKPDGYVEVNPGSRFEVAPAGDLAAGQFQLLQHATSEMQALLDDLTL